ncbi:MAG: alpha-mannosidase [Lentisphaerae bacterium]|nr:alpha-mannosidase [Lentisphaerota bacterium]
MQVDELSYIKHNLTAAIERLRNDLYSAAAALEVEYAPESTPGKLWPPPQEWQSITAGTRWGGAWDYAWFRIKGAWSAEDCAAQNCLLYLDLGGEGMVFDAAGNPLTAISKYSVFAPEVEKVRVDIPQVKAGEFCFYARVSGHYLNGLAMDTEAYSDSIPMNYTRYNAVFSRAEKMRRNQEVYLYRQELMLLKGILNVTADPNKERKLAGIIRRSLNIYADDRENAPQARAILQEYWQHKADSMQLAATAIGHSHLDIGWLWPVEEGEEKAIRTFSEQMTHLERNSDYVYGASQVYLYEKIEERCPELFEKIKRMVAANRWELQGGMYVEGDTNCAGGEALVRQFLYGKRYFLEKFGVDVKNVWLPDSFGFSAILPQVAALSGCFAMVTAKPFWAHCYAPDECSKFPYSAFIWQGLGDKEILVNILPECYYNGVFSGENLADAKKFFTESDILNEFLLPFGIGDGGGGPNNDMINGAYYFKDLVDQPRVTFGKAADSLERQYAYRDQLPRHKGEIYLELHRGTLTTIGKIKKLNRLLEGKLIALDRLNALAPQPVKGKAIEKLWKVLLLNQFHDILPGSSIPELYRRNFAALEKVSSDIDEITAFLACQLLSEQPDAVTFFNPAAHRVINRVQLPESWCGIVPDKQVAVQSDGKVLTAEIVLEPLQSLTILRSDDNATEQAENISDPVLENDLVRCIFSPDGHLISMIDKLSGTELIPPDAQGNALKLYVDRPNQFDAWDVDIEYERMLCNQIQGKLIEHTRGSACDSMIWEFEFSHSKIVQHIQLGHFSRQLDFKTKVDWHETHRMLRVDFPLALDFDSVRCEQGFGFIRRSSRRNTPQEKHCFEFSAQRFIAAGEGQVRAGLLSDCKYGYKAYGNSIGLNLLRSPRYPDEVTDRGEHELTYSLVFSIGEYSDKTIRQAAYALNRPAFRFDNRAGAVNDFIKALDIAGVTIEAVKISEDDPAVCIVRLAEQYGNQVGGKLHWRQPYCAAECDLLEKVYTAMPPLPADSIQLEFKAFEIKSIAVKVR